MSEKEGKAGADPEGMWKGQYKGIDDWELREAEDFYGNAAA